MSLYILMDNKFIALVSILCLLEANYAADGQVIMQDNILFNFIIHRLFQLVIFLIDQVQHFQMCGFRNFSGCIVLWHSFQPSIPTVTANISKFSDSENAPKNLENMCNYASLFWSRKWRKNKRFVQKISAQKYLEKSTGLLSIFWCGELQQWM